MSKLMAANYHRSTAGLVGLSALALTALWGPAALAAERSLVVRGAGSGHGVGLSQWGAYGYARHGADYRTILRHYYTGTTLGTVPASRPVRVLLAGNRTEITVTGASAASPATSPATATGRRHPAGTRAGSALRLDPGTTYIARRASQSTLLVRDGAGHAIGTWAAPIRLIGPAPLVLRGAAIGGSRDRAYRGALELAPGHHGGVNAVNVVGVDDYLRGVVALESSSSWPAAALEAQAVASRTFALTGGVAGMSGFTLYADTRSQAYGGLRAERASTDRAVQATRGQVVTYGGHPVVTYYFDTSGGQTENVENVFTGASAAPWLRGVSDPYDSLSPLHRWGPVRIGFRAVQARLAGLVRGSFTGIEVTRRGVSPRIVEAVIVGSGGRRTVSGAQLCQRLGLQDRWAYFSVRDPSGSEHALPDAGRRPAASPAAGAAGPGGGEAAPADSADSSSPSSFDAAANPGGPAAAPPAMDPSGGTASSRRR
ncbi:MAG TPA: SpoIID/LytB domain-containing protein [Solirubrobacteraceae bacterium]|jgi:stage II sporulation protein D|nr:SpoIID/LytB domain-containing protein [Solirubrobacteraceae bacterium]